MHVPGLRADSLPHSPHKPPASGAPRRQQRCWDPETEPPAATPRSYGCARKGGNEILPNADLIGTSCSQVSVCVYVRMYVLNNRVAVCVCVLVSMFLFVCIPLVYKTGSPEPCWMTLHSQLEVDCSGSPCAQVGQ